LVKRKRGVLGFKKRTPWLSFRALRYKNGRKKKKVGVWENP